MIDQLIRDAFDEVITETPPPPSFPPIAPRTRRTAWLTPAMALGAGAAAVLLAFGWANLMSPGGTPDPAGTPPPVSSEPTTTLAAVTTLSPGVAVPDVIGLDGAAAITALEAAGFSAIWSDENGHPDDTVRGQLPTPGSPAEPGSTVVISLRPACALYEAQRESEEDVIVLFPCAPTLDELDFQPVWRARQIGEDEVTATFRNLVSGPTDFERDLSFSSFFDLETAAALNTVTLTGAALVLDFNDAIVVNNASTSTGGIQFNDELRANAFQFPEVDSVEFRLDGSCEAWSTLFESDGCWVITRAQWEQQAD